MMRLGFTGSRLRPVDVQKRWLGQVFQDQQPTEFHHGACQGSDEFAHVLAIEWSRRCPLLTDIYVHPPTDQRLMMPMDHIWSDEPPWLNITMLPAKPYLDRNQDIVDLSEALVALPDGPERLHSGTWSTIRYARRTKTPHAICLPDGQIKAKAY